MERYLTAAHHASAVVSIVSFENGSCGLSKTENFGGMRGADSMSHRLTFLALSEHGVTS